MSPVTISREGGRQATVSEDLGRLLKLAGPVVISRLGIMAMGLTDIVIVGRYSATQLSYHAIAWGLATVVLTMAIGLQVGVQVMTARAIGEGHKEKTGAVLRRGIAYGVWLGLFSMALLFFGGPLALHALRLDADLARGASTVLRVFALAMPFYAVGVAATFWLEGHGRPGPAAVIMWVANLVNLAVGLLLTPGTFGLPALGAVGAACATCLAQTFMACAMFGYIASMPEARSWGVFDKAPRDPVAEAEQRRIGYGAGASNVFETAAFAGMNVIAGYISALSVAAWAVVLNVAAIIFMAPLGLSTAGAVLVGRAYGARDAGRRVAGRDDRVRHGRGLRRARGPGPVAVRALAGGRLHHRPKGRGARDPDHGDGRPLPDPRRPAGGRRPGAAGQGRRPGPELHASGELYPADAAAGLVAGDPAGPRPRRHPLGGRRRELRGRQPPARALLDAGAQALAAVDPCLGRMALAM